MPTKPKIVVFSGAGISAESGLKTFRDHDGLWNNYSIEDVCSVEAWQKQPQVVLEFYNMRRREAAKAQPNAAHLAIAKLESAYDVTVITQNVDDLHEKAGSMRVLHVHGELAKARSCADENLVYPIGSKDIVWGELCDKGSQLRPHIVWFGENVMHLDTALDCFMAADKVLVVGTSLSVFPVAGLVRYAEQANEKILVSLDVDNVPWDYDFKRAKATEAVPGVVEHWLNKASTGDA
jgi:NAD-dependent deacetylase